jgi:PAS domain S-box-containing protein
MMPDFESMMRRQQILGDFGEFVLRSQDLDQVLQKACILVSEALGTERAKVLEILHTEQQLLVRAGVGWDPDIVGNLRLPMQEHSSETYAIQSGAPVVTQDIGKERRFQVPPFMKDAGVVALVNVPIFLPGGRPFGLLQVDDTSPHEFDEGDVQFLRTYTTILGPVIDRLLIAGTLRSTEERFRFTVEAALDYAILTIDPQGRITDWLPGAAAVFGWRREEAVGQPVAITFTPEDRESRLDQSELDIARREGVAPSIRWHLRKDGRRVFIQGSNRALRNSDGTLHGFLKIGQDVTQRLQAEERLLEEKERFRILVEAMPQLLWRSADGGNWTWSSPQWRDHTGQSQEESRGLGWLQAVHPNDREAAMQAWAKAPEQGGLNVEYRLRRAADNSYRWHHTRAVALHDDSEGSGPEDRAADWLGTSTDIDDLKHLQGQQGVLVSELQHRTRNLLGVVQAIAKRSFSSAPGRKEFDSRLSALGRVQSFLSRSPGWMVLLSDLLEAELIAVGSGRSDRVVVEGPPLQLPGDKVQALALALHELVTNAVKYGAIAQPGARLKITWHLESNDEIRCLVLDWRESGVAMPAGSPEQRGYGSELIERALPYQLRAKTRMEFGSDGVHCAIRLPLGDLGEEEQDP